MSCKTAVGFSVQKNQSKCIFLVYLKYALYDIFFSVLFHDILHLHVVKEGEKFGETSDDVKGSNAVEKSHPPLPSKEVKPVSLNSSSSKPNTLEIPAYNSLGYARNPSPAGTQ